MRLSDRMSGAGLATLGALAAWGGSRLPAVPGQDVGPAAFPMVIGGGLILCGLLIATGVGRGFEPLATDQDEAQPRNSLRVLVPPLLLLFYMLAVEGLGFLPTAFLVVLAGSFALGARPRIAIPMAIIAPLLVHAAFAKLLRVPLPDGLLPAPW